jgi:hypothetical protein
MSIVGNSRHDLTLELATEPTTTTNPNGHHDSRGRRGQAELPRRGLCRPPERDRRTETPCCREDAVGLGGRSRGCCGCKDPPSSGPVRALVGVAQHCTKSLTLWCTPLAAAQLQHRTLRGTQLRRGRQQASVRRRSSDAQYNGTASTDCPCASPRRSCTARRPC